ncbi:MAG: riboflavin synthase [Candidatus Diapherotrites archaeon]|nr:riboflavin synthase [Candidatus Diapherotrites archaeon]
MFSGIVEKLTGVKAVERKKDFAAITLAMGGVKTGESVAVNGVCLTATKTGRGTASFDVMSETLKKTNLSGLKKGSKVNIELPLRVGDRVGGHFVLGHVDCTARIVSKKHEGKNCVMTFSVPAGHSKYLVEKGSIALDGISLTIFNIANNGFSVALIPHTLKKTTLGFKEPGDDVNAEFDYLAKIALKAGR